MKTLNELKIKFLTAFIIETIWIALSVYMFMHGEIVAGLLCWVIIEVCHLRYVIEKKDLK